MPIASGGVPEGDIVRVRLVVELSACSSHISEDKVPALGDYRAARDLVQ